MRTILLSLLLLSFLSCKKEQVGQEINKTTNPNEYLEQWIGAYAGTCEYAFSHPYDPIYYKENAYVEIKRSSKDSCITFHMELDSTGTRALNDIKIGVHGIYNEGYLRQITFTQDSLFLLDCIVFSGNAGIYACWDMKLEKL
ncbi:MAG: hypothetical protein N4A46_15320 [Schleiferiaceae bacterium]|nr:hypothetical protein [Schleiferiaceae bacterium]